MPNVEQLLPTSEAASILQCDVRTIHRLVRRGQLTPTLKAPGLRGAYMFRRADVEALAQRAA
jgi:DNA-binding transcriptional MerR regulator